MKINWKLRVKNKTVLAALIACLVTFIYQVLGILDITAPIAEDQVTQAVGLLINILAGLGVIVDPTTVGAGDSQNALTYDNPR